MFIEHDGGSYRVDATSVRVDLEWFGQYAAQAEAAAARGDEELAGAYARAALELCNGDLSISVLGPGPWVESLESSVVERRARMADLVRIDARRELPGVEYAVDDGRYLAYWSFGAGSPTFLVLGGLATHLEGQWSEANWASWAARLASQGRVVCFDKRGCGLSDPISAVPTVDDFVHDAITVLDAIGSDGVVLIACAEAGLFAPRLANVDPRVQGVVSLNDVPRVLRDESFEFGLPLPASTEFFFDIQDRWGVDPVALELAAPSMVADGPFCQWAVRYQRLCATPGSLRLLAQFTVEADGRDDVAAVTQPALELQSARSRYFSPRNAGWLGQHLRACRVVWLDSADHLYWLPEPDRVHGEITEFVRALSDSL